MPQFSNLIGVCSGKLEGPIVNSITELMKVIRTEKICSSAGSNGSITVWFDDLGFIHAAFDRYQHTIDHTTFHKKVRLKKWLDNWWPQMER